MKNADDIVIVSGVRTAIGTLGGSLKNIHQGDLGATVIREAVSRAKIDPAMVDEVIVGNVGQIAESGFIGRICQLRAGLPEATTAYSVNRQCGSGLQAVANGLMQIQTEQVDIVVACGTENMSQLPYYVRQGRYGYNMGDGKLEDGLVSILTWPEGPYHNGMTAENVADRFNVSREEMDDFSASSQKKVAQAIEAGFFIDEIVPITVNVNRKEIKIFDTDEHPRLVDREKLATLRPAFKKDGSVTAANSSGINDGAAAVVMMKRSKALELGLKPRITIRGWAVAGCSPDIMGFGPSPATKKLLKKFNLTHDEIDLYEINEAFAAQAIAVIKDLGIDEQKVNVNGGAIALGHPVGATGTILTVKMMYEMERRDAKTGIITMCIGGGQGISMLFERG